MKLAIQGHFKRGKEVIQILESLGGINRENNKGCYDEYFYYISGDNKTIKWTCIRPQHLGVFTLEEFEKEFPFKVGDLCIYYSDILNEEIIVKILGMIITDNCIMYEVGHKDIIDTHSYIYRKRNTLKPYKEMKEERNITLTLDKAKEWYKKGGELKEIALQVFTEKELNPLSRSWEEFCDNYPVKKGECWIGSQDSIYCATITQDRKYKNWIPSMKSAEAHVAMIQLEQLRDCWRQGWKPELGNSSFAIKVIKELEVSCFCSREFLSFPTREMAEKFLECFRDLIEKAGDLI